jgi:two-component system response regulator NreC
VEQYPNIPVLILSMHNNEDFICNSIKAGAKGYLPKDIRREELLKAIQALHQGENYYSQEVNEIIVRSFVQRSIQDEKSEEEKSLTKREIEIIKLVSEGFINKEIADKLSISIRTVDAHKSNIMQKLKLKSNVEMVKYAIKNKLIQI